MIGFHWDDEKWPGFEMGHGATIRSSRERKRRTSIRSHSPQITGRINRKRRRR